ncbi:AcrR family transcriptional regulator [Paenibacillus endophyticus]|uniref:AcrR family transcriptional regulator n=1 Tax=Paenibacillus endophyticus TaxID=1294268 RepID=A0A7W5C7Z3_9BACL|nr:TetR/AcrR family transcriptional regulator [Paenibacillus endophyticus]MBB3152825.1 AcrR family transcriptional regulator [Paenibacillus endophyticus]
MSNQLDRRQVRTKRLLYEALMSLIAEKGADHVTVTDIANRAEINRGTFYLHYRDVPDMLEQLKEHVFEKVRNRITQLNFQDAIHYMDRNEVYPVSVQLFEEIAEHADFLKTMFGPKGDLAYAIRFRELFASHIYAKTQQLGGTSPAAIPPDYIVAYVTSANFGLIMHWLETGLNRTPSEISSYMARIIKLGPMLAFGLHGLPNVDHTLNSER